MQNQIHLYISAAPELAAERDELARMVTNIPTTLGWEIVHTPHGDQTLNLPAALRADVHLLVLGEDIKAPVGLEWLVARRAGRTPTLFRQERLRTPAADAFARELAAHAQWRTYHTAADLSAQAAKLLVDYMLAHAAGFALAVVEVERLRVWLQSGFAGPATQDPLRHAAGESGVILSTDRYVPSDGTLVG
jgi:hypothetical protein